MYQFATSETTPSLVIEQVTSAIDGGCKWIRLFGNNLPIDTIKDVVSKCQQTDIILILDNNVELVDQLRVHGVHLTDWTRGKLIEIREKLGPHAIIGLTCESSERLNELKGLDIDYLTIPAPKTENPTEFYQSFINLHHSLKLEIHPVAAGNIPVVLRQAILATGIEGIEISETWNL
jgi:thiamine monophosphate synthase